jgi:hypothetical protein
MSVEQTRKDPFDLGDLSDFGPTPARKAPPSPAVVREISEANNFTSRSPAKAKPAKPPVAQRRRRTGRNAQFNIKATQATIERFVALADRHNFVFGELLEKALDAFEAQQKGRA